MQLPVGRVMGQVVWVGAHLKVRNHTAPVSTIPVEITLLAPAALMCWRNT